MDTNDPTLAADFDASATDFEGGFGVDQLFASVTFTELTDALDPSAFTAVAFRTTPLVTWPWALITRCLPAAWVPTLTSLSPWFR